jgi:hypothetical protein
MASGNWPVRFCALRSLQEPALTVGCTESKSVARADAHAHYPADAPQVAECRRHRADEVRCGNGGRRGEISNEARLDDTTVGGEDDGQRAAGRRDCSGHCRAIEAHEQWSTSRCAVVQLDIVVTGLGAELTEAHRDRAARRHNPRASGRVGVVARAVADPDCRRGQCKLGRARACRGGRCDQQVRGNDGACCRARRAAPRPRRARGRLEGDRLNRACRQSWDACTVLPTTWEPASAHC